MSSHDRTEITRFGGRARREMPSPSCQGRYCPRDQALRLTLTPLAKVVVAQDSPRPAPLPHSALFAEAARHSPYQTVGRRAPSQEGRGVPVSHWGLHMVCLFPEMRVSELSLSGRPACLSTNPSSPDQGL